MRRITVASCLACVFLSAPAIVRSTVTGTPSTMIAPHITGFSPAGGPPGTVVSIRGTGFTGTSSVKFNGKSAGYSPTSDTLVIATVPSLATTGPITITTPGGTDTSSTSFFVGNPPAVSGFSPAGGGSGTSVTITGSSFNGVTSVQFNGTSAEFSPNSSTQITATVPDGATTGRISVSNPAGTGLSSQTFYLPPRITGFFPTGGPPGTQVNIYGTDLSTVYDVRFSGIYATPYVQSDNVVVAYVPNGASTGPIQVSATGGTAVSPTSFFVGYPPIISSFSPAGGPHGSSVIISGTGFTGTNLVEFNGTSADMFNVDSDNQITATVPSGATTGPIAVTNPAGSSQSSQSFFVGAPPLVSGFSPAFGPVGAPVTIAGTNFSGVTRVQFGSIDAAFTTSSSTRITTTVPTGAKTAAITVTNPAGSGTSSTVFGVAPSISAFTPSCIRSDAQVGALITIFGSNLTGASSVRFNDVPVQFSIVSDERITATLGPGDVSGTVSVTTPYGTGVGASNFMVIHLEPPPRTAGVDWPSDPAVNVPACAAAGDQTGPVAVSDGVGGTIVAWQDHRNGNWDIYAQRIDKYGAVPSGWQTNGLPICSAPGDQVSPAIVSNDVGGAIIAWQDGRNGDWNIYAQQVTGDGSLEGGWPADGLPLCTAPGTQSNPAIATDGSCGAVVTWQDARAGNWDIYASRVLEGGVVADGWGANGNSVCTVGADQLYPAITSDLTGGAIIAWQDSRYCTWHIFAMRIGNDGAPSQTWRANGTPLSCEACCWSQYNPRIASDGQSGCYVVWEDDRCYRNVFLQRVMGSGAIAPGWDGNFGLNVSRYCNWNQYSPDLTPDGAGGAFVCWYDLRTGSADIYVQRITPGGAIRDGWSRDGLAVSVASGEQVYPRIAGDGYGGCFVTWEDRRTDQDIYAQRISASGAIYPFWPATGAPVSRAAGAQSTPVIVSSGPGLAIVTWLDTRSGAYDVYTQLLDGSGKLGDPSPLITSIADVSGDQGGHVRIKWQRSYLDSLPTLEIAGYGIWRQVSAAVAMKASSRGAKLWSEGQDRRPAPTAQPGLFRVTSTESGSSYWEGVASIFARGQDTYSFVAETFQDSTPASNPKTVFMVDAHAASGPYFWDSPPDSGYSVDNLPPGAPLNFSAQYLGSETRLHWSPSGDPDFWNFRVYRGSSQDFVPRTTNLIATQPDTGFIDRAGGFNFYKLSAVDLHGNESGFGTIGPGGALGVGAPFPTELSLYSIEPNPVRVSAVIRFATPRTGRVRLSLFDAAGRLVREIQSGTLPAGEHDVRWDPRVAGDVPLASGLYFLSLEAGGKVLTRRMAVLR